MQRPDCPHPLALPASGATASLKGLVMNGLGGVVFLLFLFVIFLIMSVGPEEFFLFLSPVPFDDCSTSC